MVCYESSKILLCHYNHELLSLQEEPGINARSILENVKMNPGSHGTVWVKVKVKREQKIEN